MAFGPSTLAQRVAGRPRPAEVAQLMRPRVISCSRARLMRSLLTWRLKRALIWTLDRPCGVTSRAWLMRRAVGSMGAVSKRRQALAQQYSHTAKAAWRW